MSQPVSDQPSSTRHGSSAPLARLLGGLDVLVVDDEAPGRDEIAYLLSRDQRIGKVIESASAREALDVLEKSRIDVAFLDVSMPERDGLSLARAIKAAAEPPLVVFVTAHDQHAVEAFEIDAVDYVLKPVRESRLSEAVRRAVTLKAEARDDAQFTVELGGRTRVLRRRDVVYVESHGDYVRLHTSTESHLIRTPLVAIERAWRDDGFVRIHRSLLVSLARVDEICVSGGRCTLSVNGHTLPVSRRHAKHVRELVRHFAAADGGT